ncbi:hypothetical protein A33Q_4258 [Indibacter alkaliphilus LW1]|uniref:Uncharacterized protein n=1 Tax=Indibacter alkaliphilus (strain CCUG 57479 / KCTC 22604 / LW1) TaxID=1189612 RepID=S2D534_INDAL|nr:hypothetical protein A33Q_4258 [Indibacter alkaliphilus LW1]
MAAFFYLKVLEKYHLKFNIPSISNLLISLLHEVENKNPEFLSIRAFDNVSLRV